MFKTIPLISAGMLVVTSLFAQNVSDSTHLDTFHITLVDTNFIELSDGDMFVKFKDSLPDGYYILDCYDDFGGLYRTYEIKFIEGLRQGKFISDGWGARSTFTYTNDTLQGPFYVQNRGKPPYMYGDYVNGKRHGLWTILPFTTQNSDGDMVKGIQILEYNQGVIVNRILIPATSRKVERFLEKLYWD